MKNLDAFKEHGDVIWNIANLLRGPYRPPQYRRVMIPLTVLRRLDCVLEESKDKVLDMHKKLKAEKKHDAETIEKIINQKFKLTFHNTSIFTFKKLLGDPDKLAANLKNYIAGFSSRARKIIEKFNFEDEIEKLEEANRLFEVVKEVAAVDLHPDTIPNIAMGYVFEDLVRRFNEQANEEAGDHFTPREVIKLMVTLLFTYDDLVYKDNKVIRIYDPTAGTGGMLSEAEKLIKDPETGLNPSANLELFGQEYNPESYAICGSDLMIKGEDVKNIIYGNTLGTGKAKEGFVDGDGHSDKKFHYMLANPPFGVEWKPEKDHVTKEHNEFGFSGRFGPGLPRINDGALLFLLHMISKMEPAPQKGSKEGRGGEGSRIGIVFNGSPLFTGDAGSGESNIRRWIIENDMLEAVIGLPDQLFYNTGISTYVWIVTNRKNPKRAGKVQLINGTDFSWKMKKSLGDKRKRIGDGTDGAPNHIEVLAKLYGDFTHDVRLTVADIQTNVDPKRDQTKSLFVSKIFDNRDFGYIKITVERPLRLNFAVTDERIARFKKTGTFLELAISRKRKNKAKIIEEELKGADAQNAILEVLDSMKPAFGKGQLIKDRTVFDEQLTEAFKAADITMDGSLRNALLAPGSLGDRDPGAEICRDKKGNPEADADLRDTENVPLPPSIDLPLPLDYEGKKNKGKVSVNALLNLVQDHCEAYLIAEVLPYRPDAWIDHSKIKVGYEIPFNRHFYEYEPPRPLEQIEADIEGLEKEIMAMLKAVTA